jgi:hypothetical protein
MQGVFVPLLATAFVRQKVGALKSIVFVKLWWSIAVAAKCCAAGS